MCGISKTLLHNQEWSPITKHNIFCLHWIRVIDCFQQRYLSWNNDFENSVSDFVWSFFSYPFNDFVQPFTLYTLPFNDWIQPFNIFSSPFNDLVQPFNILSFPFNFFSTV